MNVLTDILCDSSSLMAPPSYKDTFTHNKISQHDISSKQGPLLLDAHLGRPLSSISHSTSPSNINIFNSTDQIHIPSSIDSGFEDGSSISVFSDSFPEIVPSWLAHDFMKVSDNLASPNLLSNVSDMYATTQDNESLEMLDLGFTPDLTPQNDPNGMNRTCMDDSQKLLNNLPLQRFSNHESLIMSPFNDIHNTHMHISMNKNDMQYQKFKQNGPVVNSAQSLMNTVLPCENELLHLPLPSSLSQQCLNSTSSPSIISQSQSHPVDVVCDKLPQITLNHLDSLLGNETALSEIQLLRHEFPNVRLSEDGCNSHSNHPCLDTYNSNNNLISCDPSSILGSNMPISQSQDVSVQVSANAISENNVPNNGNCFSCNEISPESPIEVVQCFKCKFCDFLSIHKCAVASHINIAHSKTHNASSSINRNVPSANKSENVKSLSVGGQVETHFNNTDPKIGANLSSVVLSNNANTALISEGNSANNGSNNKFTCTQCNIMFANISDYNSHLLSNHNKPNHIQLSSTNSPAVGYELIAINGLVLNAPLKKNDVNFPVSSVSNITQNEISKSSKQKISRKKAENTQKKNQLKKTAAESTLANTEKNMSSHKKAWQKKMRRELGSYMLVLIFIIHMNHCIKVPFCL